MSVGRSSVKRLEAGGEPGTGNRLWVGRFCVYVPPCHRAIVFLCLCSSHPRPSVTTMNSHWELRVRAHRLRPTVAFESYWRLAAERQRMFFRRVAGQPGPWTDDPVLAKHRFTNAYRASDRVSQYLINIVIYGSDTDDVSTVLRVLLFKIFNRIDTWQAIEHRLGHVDRETFDAQILNDLLDQRMQDGHRLYSAAYIMPTPKLGQIRKHANHLQLLASLLRDGTLERLVEARTLGDLYVSLASVPSFGPFLGFQFAIDLNYTPVYRFSEMEFVVAGPGAHDGIAKCFEETADLSAEDVIRGVTEGAEDCLTAFGIEFPDLWGRPLQLIDCQNLFCEVSKYARVRHPELTGPSGRTQIKQRFQPHSLGLDPHYPPKWAHEYSPLIPVSEPLSHSPLAPPGQGSPPASANRRIASRTAL